MRQFLIKKTGTVKIVNNNQIIIPALSGEIDLTFQAGTICRVEVPLQIEPIHADDLNGMSFVVKLDELPALKGLCLLSGNVSDGVIVGVLSNMTGSDIRLADRSPLFNIDINERASIKMVQKLEIKTAPAKPTTKKKRSRR
jgi:hypothetical protein